MRDEMRDERDEMLQTREMSDSSCPTDSERVQQTLWESKSDSERP